MVPASMVVAFPGQGIQKPGMAAAIYGTPAWTFFEEASELLGYDLGRLCLEGPQESLDNTVRTQAAIFVTCWSLWELNKTRFQPKVFLGHSLGEIIALGAAGAFTFREGVQVVKARGEAMSQVTTGGMAAILGLDGETIQSLCAQVAPAGSVVVANWNSPGQTVVSGGFEALKALTALALGRGAKRIVQLNVSGPFHSRLMEPAALQFSEVVRCLALSPCHTPVLSNDGKSILERPEEIRHSLTRQITGPVHFKDQVQKLPQMGVGHFVELSPASVLIPLARRSEPNLQFTLVSDGGMV
ncbi:MAG TPA: malonyl CoA-acyl carrier protein transacylase [Firmicutes bacterium]|mgnify:CR=1 FL=1|nr:malonyl CoA-acyl carrier protein transacylase [Bacillota bacterium]